MTVKTADQKMTPTVTLKCQSSENNAEQLHLNLQKLFIQNGHILLEDNQNLVSSVTISNIL